jgi:hypothetical protein
MKLIVEMNDVMKFKYCPYCGAGPHTISVYDGDYNGQTECLACDEEMPFVILEEYRDRYPVKFKQYYLGVPYKTFVVVYYNHFAQQTQVWKVTESNAFRAGRAFYRKFKALAKYRVIETIYEV